MVSLRACSRILKITFYHIRIENFTIEMCPFRIEGMIITHRNGEDPLFFRQLLAAVVFGVTGWLMTISTTTTDITTLATITNSPIGIHAYISAHDLKSKNLPWMECFQSLLHSPKIKCLIAVRVFSFSFLANLSFSGDSRRITKKPLRHRQWSNFLKIQRPNRMFNTTIEWRGIWIFYFKL